MPAAAPVAIKSVRLKVGLEIHIELATRSKMFARAGSPGNPEFYDREPNSLVTPTVAALPGTLTRIFALIAKMTLSAGYTEAIGTDLGIVTQTIDTLCATIGATPSDIILQISPCIRPPPL